MGDGGKLSEDSTTIVWKNVATGQERHDPSRFHVPSRSKATLNLGNATDRTSDGNGFSLVIAGIRVNASSVGDGEDITAVVMVKGSAVGNPLKVADVSTGLAIKAKAASGLQCADKQSARWPWLSSRSKKATRPGSCRECKRRDGG